MMVKPPVYEEMKEMLTRDQKLPEMRPPVHFHLSPGDAVIWHQPEPKETSFLSQKLSRDPHLVKMDTVPTILSAQIASREDLSPS